MALLKSEDSESDRAPAMLLWHLRGNLISEATTNPKGDLANNLFDAARGCSGIECIELVGAGLKLPFRNIL
eukprot:3628385-Pyramimonas_sp.AAC.1